MTADNTETDSWKINVSDTPGVKISLTDPTEQ